MSKEISIIQSFETDLNRLIDDFVSIGNGANFNEFAKLWRSKRFYLIFHGILHVNQLHEFVDEIFELCLKRLQTEEVYLRKVALMFMLYACYFKQPDEEVKFNIRLQESHLELIRAFMDECEQKSNHEVIYCWRKLLADGAVDFVCQLNYYGPWFIRRQNYDQESIRSNTVDEQFTKHLKDLNKFQSDYDKLKLNVEDDEDEIRTLDLIDDNRTLYSDYIDKFEDLKKKFNKSPNCT